MAKMPNYSTKQLTAIARLQGHPMAMHVSAGNALRSSLMSGELVVIEESEPHEVIIVEPGDNINLVEAFTRPDDFIHPVATSEARVPRLPRTDKAIAIVQVRGSIGQRRGGDFWAGTFSEDVDNQLRSIAVNPNIGAVVMEFDTPGGIVTGIPELAATINEVKQVKPIYSLANGMSASAGFWLSSQATRAFASPSAEVGSHGVWSAHIDQSKMLEDFGVDVTLISAGKFKVEGHPFGPLDDEARTEIQRGVDLAFGQFTNALAEGRNTNPIHVLDNFGQGRMIEADRAKSLGMIDGVATMNELLAGIIKPLKSSRGRAKSLDLDIRIEEEMGRG